MIALGRLWGWETEVADWRPCPMTTLIILPILNTHVKLYGRYSHGLYQDTISKSFSTVTEENNVHPHSILIPTRNLSDTKRRYFNFYSCSNWKMYILIEVILWTADGLICWRDFVLLQNQSVHNCLDKIHQFAFCWTSCCLSYETRSTGTKFCSFN